jgi:hypothetical protein
MRSWGPAPPPLHPHCHATPAFHGRRPVVLPQGSLVPGRRRPTGYRHERSASPPAMRSPLSWPVAMSRSCGYSTTCAPTWRFDPSRSDCVLVPWSDQLENVVPYFCWWALYPLRHEQDARGAVGWGADAESEYGSRSTSHLPVLHWVWKIRYEIKENI